MESLIFCGARILKVDALFLHIDFLHIELLKWHFRSSADIQEDPNCMGSGVGSSWSWPAAESTLEVLTQASGCVLGL